MKIRSLTLSVVAALQLAAASADAQEHVAHGRFADVALYRPAAEVKSFVLFLSGDGGWNQGVEDMARALAGEGALVAGVDVPKFLASFRGDGTSCVNPDGDLENLSHYLQGYAQLPTYFAPMLVGYSSGASLAYAMLAQAGSGTFAGTAGTSTKPPLIAGRPSEMPPGESIVARAVKVSETRPPTVERIENAPPKKLSRSIGLSGPEVR